MSLGRALTRRSGSRCEISGASGVKLVPVEIAPLMEDPEVDRTVFVREDIADALAGGRMQGSDTWRFLEQAAWSEVPVVQVAAVRLLRRASETGTMWASEALATLYLEPEVEDWLSSS